MIDPVAFQIGPFSVRWYGIIIGFAVLLGIFLAIKESKRKGVDPEFFLDFIILGVPLAIICARIYYVIFQWDLYQGNIMKIFAIWEGGIAIHGSIIGGLLALYFLSRRRNVNFLLAVDILTPSLIIGQAIGRWGNFINQEAHGGIVSQKFISHFPRFIQKQMYIFGHYYHPTFLYESIWDVMVFIFLIVIRRRNFIKNGDIFFLYLICYSLGRFFIEGLRTDSLMFGPIRVAQLVSILLIVIGIIAINRRHAGDIT